MNGLVSTGLVNRKKIIYDRDDFQLCSKSNSNESEDCSESNSRAKLPKEHLTISSLTLMEEVLLLGLKDKEGYVSFWNDNLSFVLRGCILIELALLNRISILRVPGESRGRALPLPSRRLQVQDIRPTYDPILNEALHLIASSPENLPISTWIDLMSGETWNFMKANFQLRQVRERIAKGINTHPVADPEKKSKVMAKVLQYLLGGLSPAPPSTETSTEVESMWLPYIRTLCLVCAAYTGSVLDAAVDKLPLPFRENSYLQADRLLCDLRQFPSKTFLQWTSDNPAIANQMELIAGVMSVFSRVDGLF